MKRHNIIHNRGVATIEYAIVFPVFLLALVIGVDLNWKMWLKSTALGGALDGIRMASQTPNFDTDVRNLDLNNPEHKELFLNYCLARARVIKAAMKTPELAGIQTFDSGAKNRFYRYHYPVACPDHASDQNVAVLRPGEYVDVYPDGVTYGGRLYHSTFPPPDEGVQIAKMEHLLMAKLPVPIEVQVDIRSEPLLPWFFPMRLSGLIRGYREHLPKSPEILLEGASLPFPGDDKPPWYKANGKTVEELNPTPPAPEAWPCVVDWERCVAIAFFRMADGKRAQCPVPTNDGSGTCLCLDCKGTTGS
jgi:Flp pilus assembly protein TadG